ncbi:hypothetical protein GGH94_005934 [Coemansia aciculifera]|uniref:F-box domain-containing protein n=1 Tax=Coemansia aciculifera TaxID=417176 RepID=A0A9W8ICV0_9FUNG|nr:hypothetical protein GGH94_005934 [Coemansia aciculifera]KAJ2870054.1 hypothetical protein GGH93_005867 [Coemansia aciculifera]
MADLSDEGFDDWPVGSGRTGSTWDLALAADEQHAMEVLAQTLRVTANPLGRTQLAVLLLGQVPADLLKTAVIHLRQLLRRDFVGMLPMEVATNILEYLPVQDIVRSASLVSRRWRAVATQACLWRRLFLRRGWRVDADRWAFYSSLPRGICPARVMLDSSVLRVSNALSLASTPNGISALLEHPPATPRQTLDSVLGEISKSYMPQRVLKQRQFISSSSSEASSRSSSPTSSPQLRSPALAIDWRMLYAEYERLEGNWRLGRCRVDRWESAHAESIYCLQFDQHNRLFSGSRDTTVKVWHLADSASQITQLATLRGHTGSVLTLQADDAVLVTGSSDATVCVWDLCTYTRTHCLHHADAVLSLRFNTKWLVTACKDRLVRVWRRDNSYKDMFELHGHDVAVNAVHLYGDMLVSASGDRSIKVWDLERRTCVLTLADHVRGVACIDFDGRFIVSGSSDRSIRIWSLDSRRCERTIHNAHSDLVRTVMFNRTMDIIVSGSYDESIKIWRFSTGALLHKIKNVHTSRVFKLMFDRSRIVSCSHDRSISIIDFAANLPHARMLV